jgi:hypothetical protein
VYREKSIATLGHIIKEEISERNQKKVTCLWLMLAVLITYLGGLVRGQSG